MWNMELAEIVSPHVTVPVLAVVFCALLFFFFGFNTSIQPPTFVFDDDQKHRRGKKIKIKTQAHESDVVIRNVIKVANIKSKRVNDVKAEDVSTTSAPTVQCLNIASYEKTFEAALFWKKKVRNVVKYDSKMNDCMLAPRIKEDKDGVWEVQRSRRYRKNRSVTENEVDGWKAGEKSDVTALVLETASFDSPEPANTRKKNMSSIHAQDSDAFDLGVPGGQEASVVFNAVDLSHASPITASAAMKEAGQTGAAFDMPTSCEASSVRKETTADCGADVCREDTHRYASCGSGVLSAATADDGSLATQPVIGGSAVAVSSVGTCNVDRQVEDVQELVGVVKATLAESANKRRKDSKDSTSNCQPSFEAKSLSIIGSPLVPTDSSQSGTQSDKTEGVPASRGDLWTSASGRKKKRPRREN